MHEPYIFSTLSLAFGALAPVRFTVVWAFQTLFIRLRRLGVIQHFLDQIRCHLFPARRCIRDEPHTKHISPNMTFPVFYQLSDLRAHFFRCEVVFI